MKDFSIVEARYAALARARKVILWVGGAALVSTFAAMMWAVALAPFAAGGVVFCGAFLVCSRQAMTGYGSHASSKEIGGLRYVFQRVLWGKMAYDDVVLFVASKHPDEFRARVQLELSGRGRFASKTRRWLWETFMASMARVNIPTSWGLDDQKVRLGLVVVEPLAKPRAKEQTEEIHHA